MLHKSKYDGQTPILYSFKNDRLTCNLTKNHKLNIIKKLFFFNFRAEIFVVGGSKKIKVDYFPRFDKTEGQILF